jgi:PAS domain S-box-containing protein
VVEKVSKSQAFLLLRYTLIIAVAYLLLVEHDFAAPPKAVVLLIVAALLSNVVMAQLPARITDSTAFYAGIILGDTLWITAALLVSGLFGPEFFYLYFFVLLLAGIGENLTLIAIGAVVVSLAYIFVVSATADAGSLWSSRLLIRIPFLLIAAAFYGYLVERVRRERQRTREEAHAVARLEEAQRILAERALQVELANEDLAREISERTQVEAALRAAKDYAENLIDSSLDMIISVDENQNIVEFNRAAEQGLGYSKAEVLGKPIGHLYADPSQGARVYGALTRYEEFTGGIRNKRKSGETFYAYLSASVICDANGTVVGSMGISRDITERKRAEEALEKLRRQNELILNSAGEGIYGLDLEGKTTFINPAAAKMIGWEVEDLIGKPQHAILHHSKPDGTPYPREECLIYAAFKDGAVHHVDTEVFWRKDGTSFPVEYVSTPMRDERGVLVGAVVNFRDITERKQAEEALYESNRRLEEALVELKATQQQVLQQERLRALGQMASGIAHDFNNALSPVLGFTELLLDRPEYLENKEKVKHYSQMMNTAAKDAANVVRRLREFYRAREEDEIFLSVDLNSLVKQVIMLTQPRWKDQALASGITIDTETHLQNVPHVAGNEAEVREVLTNLIFNAVDAMPEGGTLTLRTRSDGQHVVVEVSDTGTGMTDEVLRRCLEPFFSTKLERGTGLGLAMVYGIIQRHQGTLAIESEPGQGTTFILRLPVYTEQGVERRSQAGEVLSRRLQILVVDDEPPVREVITAYLAGDGHTVETASNGSEGLEKFLAGGFDVVVTDQGMPEMAGDQLAAAIRRIAPDMPVILLTGFGDLMIASGETPAGVDIIVGKPVALAALRQALAKVTAEKIPVAE